MPYLSTAPHPISAPITAVIREHQARLIRRANPPDAGAWEFPGGKIDRRKPLFQAAIRDLTKDNARAAWQIDLSALNETSLVPSHDEAEIADQTAALMSERPS